MNSLQELKEGKIERNNIKWKLETKLKNKKLRLREKDKKWNSVPP